LDGRSRKPFQNSCRSPTVGLMEKTT
jgi:hypothetical protein